MSAGIPVLRAEDLTRRFGDRDVVQGVLLGLEPGESAAVLGPSGSGKTTLLHMIGILERPTRGRVLLDGADAWSGGAAQRARRRLCSIGFVTQQGNLIGHLSARDNVALPSWRKSGYRAGALRKADEILEQLGVSAVAAERAATLSAGEAQRVAIARALVNAPRLLLADEPTANVDSENGARILEALSMAQRQGAATLLVTHDAAVAARMGRILRLLDGRLIS